MLLILIVGPFVGSGGFVLIKSAGVDSYLSIIIGTILGIPLILLYLYINNYEKDKTIKEKINLVFGNKIGTIINFLLCLCFFTISIFTMYNLINFIVSQFLNKTPFYIVGILFSLIIIYINIKGIEVMSRTMLIITILNISLFIFAFIGLIPHIDLDNIKPFLEHGINRPLIGSFYTITMNITLLFLLLIIPKNDIVATKNFNKWIIITYFISLLIVFIFLFVTLTTLGINLASIYQYPEYIVLKRIHIFNFLDRIENIIIIQWIFGLFSIISIIVYYISNTIKTNNNNKLIPTIITFSILTLSLTFFKNNTQFNDFTYKYLPFVRLFVLILIFLISFKIFLKKKKASNTPT